MNKSPLESRKIWVIPAQISSHQEGQPNGDGTSGRENLSAKQSALSAIAITSEVLTEKLDETVQLLGEALHHAAQKVKPTSMEVTFGLVLDVEANILVGKLSGSSNISVTLKWEFKDAK